MLRYLGLFGSKVRSFFWSLMPVSPSRVVDGKKYSAASLWRRDSGHRIYTIDHLSVVCTMTRWDASVPIEKSMFIQSSKSNTLHWPSMFIQAPALLGEKPNEMRRLHYKEPLEGQKDWKQSYNKLKSAHPKFYHSIWQEYMSKLVKCRVIYLPGFR